MFNPYFIVTFLYFALAILGALDASLVNFQFLPVFTGIRWIRVHLITLGMMTEFAFGILPIIISMKANLPRPKVRWDIWLTLNAGLLILLIAIPTMNLPLITAGGALIFTAACLLILQLAQLRLVDHAAQASGSRKFYIAGLSYLLLGILIGTGLWQSWLVGFQIKVPIEVHIHANNWGFMSLMFAGLLVDLYPGFAKRPLAWPRSITPIFWMMTIGALGLVLGPWTKLEIFTVPGLLLHLSATIWLLVNVIKPLRADGQWKTVGVLHLTTAYLWILAPVLVAPLILLKVPGFPGIGIEQNAPQALIYGWVLQFSYAIIPLLFRRFLQTGEPPTLGGNWLSLIAVHIGGLLLWAGIFLPDSQATLHGLAYGLWMLSMLPIAWQVWQIVQSSKATLQLEG